MGPSILREVLDKVLSGAGLSLMEMVYEELEHIAVSTPEQNAQSRSTGG